MNLLFRLLYLWIVVRFKPKQDLWSTFVTTHRVLPSDLDPLLHVNNGKYFSLMDLGRWDLMHRTGYRKLLKAYGWYPVVVAETFHFRRSLTLFEKFRIETRLLGSDERSVYIEHRFMRREELVAFGMIQGRFLSRKNAQTVSPQEVIAAFGDTRPQPQLAEFVGQWLASDAMHHAMIRKASLTGSESRG